MRGSSKIASDWFVAGFAGVRPDKFRPDDLRGRKDGTIGLKRAARKQNDGQRGCSPDRPQQFLASTVQRSNWPLESHNARSFARNAET